MYKKAHMAHHVFMIIIATIYTAKLVKFNRNFAIPITTNHSSGFHQWKMCERIGKL